MSPIFFLQKRAFIIGSYSSTLGTSVMMSRELMNKIQLWNPLFEGRKLGSFFLCIFRKILCIYKIRLQLQNFHPKTPKQIWESCNTYSHGITSWEKWYSTKSEKQLRLLCILFSQTWWSLIFINNITCVVY